MNLVFSDEIPQTFHLLQGQPQVSLNSWCRRWPIVLRANQYSWVIQTASQLHQYNYLHMPLSTSAYPLAHVVKNAWTTFFLLSSFTLHYILFIVVGAPCLHLFLNKADKQISSTLTSLFIQIEWILMPEWSWWKSYSMNFKTNVPRVAQGWDQVGLVVHEVAQLVLHHRLPQLILEHEDPFLLQTDRVIGGSLKWNNCKF